MRGCSYAAAASSTSFQKLITTPPTWAPVRVSRVSLIHGIESWNDMQIGVLKSQILVGGCTDNGLLPNFPSIRRNPFVPLVSSEYQVELEIDNEDEIQTQLPDQVLPICASDSSPTVQKIRLELQRECQFGEQFLVAGDHPALGLWNPMDAAPMVWSDGHVWTAELELPAGKLIQFKFIFRDISGEILWQPGPNRFLQTRDTNKVTVVFGDWETLSVQQEELMIHEDKQVSYDEGVNINKNEKRQLDSYASSIISLNGETMAMVADIEQEMPVLVPGLTPFLIKPAAMEEGLELDAFDNAKNTIGPESSIDLDLNESEIEWSKENEEEEEQELDLFGYPNKPGFGNGHGSDKGLQLILYEGQGNRNRSILHNGIKWCQETLKSFFDKLGVQLQL